jgi:hypothetical protein
VCVEVLECVYKFYHEFENTVEPEFLSGSQARARARCARADDFKSHKVRVRKTFNPGFLDPLSAKMGRYVKRI